MQKFEVYCFIVKDYEGTIHHVNIEAGDFYLSLDKLIEWYKNAGFPDYEEDVKFKFHKKINCMR